MRLLCACLVLSILSPLRGSGLLQAQGLNAPPAFFVESIRIDHAERAQLDVILTESRLQTQQSYTEAELQNGCNRIVQLPFIKGAQIALERGSEPGKFVLVIEIAEAKTWFLAFDFSGEFLSDDLSTMAAETSSEDGRIIGLVGRQFFLGRAGVLTTALGGKTGDLHLQYTQYDLFGRGIGLSATYEVGFCDEDPAARDEVCNTSKADLGTDPTFSAWSQTGIRQRVVGSLTVPLAPTLSLLLEGDFRHTEEGYKHPAFQPLEDTFYRYRELHQLSVRVGALRDRLDDPVAPTSGLRLEVALSHRRTTGDFRLGLDESPQAPTFDARILESGVSASVIRYWPVGDDSVFATGDLFVGKSKWQDLPIRGESSLTASATALRASLGFGHAVHLWRSSKPGKLADLRLETDFTAYWDGTSPSLDLADDFLPSLDGIPSLEANPLRSMRLRSALVYRSRGTVLRFSLAYRELFLP